MCATIRQKRTFKKVLENGGIVSKAAKGIYSDAMAKNPQKITNSKGFQELFNEVVTDRKLRNKHNSLLEDNKSEIQIKALDLAYKVKGHYAPEKKQSVNLNLNTELKNSKESKDLVEEYEDKLKGMLKEPKTKPETAM